MTNESIVITGMARTPIGSFQGQFANTPAPELGAAAIKAATGRSLLNNTDVDAVIMGCVLQAGQRQAPARQAALGAGLTNATSCTTINKMCGSGMQAIMMAHDQIKAGTFDVMIAGGMESMTNAPYVMPKARSGLRLGHGQIFDHMFYDGLEDAYEQGSLMGVFAERCASKYEFSREIQDEFALGSIDKSYQAQQAGYFKPEIIPVTVKTRKSEIVCEEDQLPDPALKTKIPNLRPAFDKEGTVTAANSSSISDGAAAMTLMTETRANQKGIQPLAKITGFATHAQEPEWFTTAPVGAIQKLFEKTGWTPESVDLFEINEAFAVVTLSAIHELNIEPAKVNVFGGACSLGHPIGASGARIMVTLINALQVKGLKRGVAALCIGGGEATAIGIELL